MKKTGKRYTYRQMYRERRFGPYWYNAIWQILRPLLIGVVTLLLVAGIGYKAWTKVYDAYLAPVTGAEEAVIIPFEVENGQSLTRVANNLEKAGLVRSHTVFKYYCDFAGMGQKIQVGTYQLSTALTMAEIADLLTMGDGNPIVRNITYIPGWTLEQFAAKLCEDGVIPDAESFLSLCRTGRDFSQFYYVSAVLESKNAAKRKYALEGYLAANTYEIYVNATPEDIITKLLSQTERVFPADYQERAAQLGYTMDEILTLASLIEKEAGTEDFARVSAVFHNRLKDKMKLSSDVTVHYITGGTNLVLTQSEMALDSPYNTYLYAGLPIGPVCSPSARAIEAALFPDETMLQEKYLYFCAKEPESGELHFSRTLEEHNRAVAEYRPLWEAYDKEHQQ